MGVAEKLAFRKGGYSHRGEETGNGTREETGT